jgi:hypothetical protein
MQVFAAYESQEFAIEKWCRCMKAILLCLDKAAIELLLPLVTLIGTWEALGLMVVARSAVRCGAVVYCRMTALHHVRRASSPIRRWCTCLNIGY